MTHPDPATARAIKPPAPASAAPAINGAAAPHAPNGQRPAAGGPEVRLFNRDISWLEFNRRVLAQATAPRSPLLTRVKFLGIFSSNLDEFFMKRVGYIRRQIEKGVGSATPDGLTPRPLLAALRAMVEELISTQATCYEREILPALAARGIHLLRYDQLTARERRSVDRWYNANVFPILTPLAVDPGHRFPFISNLSENIGVTVAQPGVGEKHFARVKIPDVLPRLIAVSGETWSGAEHPTLPREASPQAPLRLISLDEVIRNNLDGLFPGMRVEEVMAFRVTRNAAIEVEEDDHEDMLQSVENELKMRRFARAVRLEVGPNPPKAILDFVTSSLRLEPEDVYERGGPLEYTDLYPIADLDLPELKEPKWAPAAPARLGAVIDDGGDIFSAIRERDILLHHPYESFSASVEQFIAAAARDPEVLAIKQTIYRTNRDSPFVASLVRAAEEGKQVACLVELRARFDESKNMRFARMLEKAGVHVAYGVVGLKTHCKTSLVVRRESGGLRCYAHLGTGNYNPSTAQLYTDLGLLTCDPGLTADVVENLFNFLTGRSLKREYEHILVAPFAMRDGFLKLIEREIALAKSGKGGVGGRIIAKMNSLEDLKLTNKLYEASAAGVQITLIVRGFCCLRPGVPGLSDNIKVISVVGRFLEHSRLYHFGAGKADPADGDWYISSADWMYRNLSSRVETGVPVRDAAARTRLKRIIAVMLEDHRNAWDLNPDGTYTQRRPDPGADPESAHAAGTFATLMREAEQGT